MSRSSLALTLEFSRQVDAEDPYAFRFEPQAYNLRTTGGGRERFDIDWSADLLADLDALRSPGRDPACMRRIGDALRQALRPAGWDRLGQQIHASASRGDPVILTLRSSAAELYALPWELITVGPSGQRLGELPGVLLRQEWPGTQSSAEDPCPRPEGGRLLLAWSAAGGGVPAAGHLQAIAAACSRGHLPFDPERDVLAGATADALATTLADAAASGRPFAALHLLCHGGRAGSTFGLVLDGPDGSPQIVDAGRLRQLLAPHAGTLRLVVLVACDGGNSGALGNHLGSAAQTLHRAGIQAVLASRAPLSVTGSVILAETLYRALLVDLSPLERAFTDARARLARDLEHLDWASLQLYAREADGDDTRPFVFRPYRGLLSFEAEHRRFFFGRDAERRETLADLQALIDGDKPRLMIIVGASGTGKSSIVLSGVVPDIEQVKARRTGAWEVARMVPGAQPLAALDASLSARADPAGPLLLVVDQFEEVFTHTGDAGTRTRFVRALWSLAAGDTGVHCILTIRIDFLGRCGEFTLDDHGTRLDRIGYDEAHRVFVAQMAPEQLRDAIEGPAARLGLILAPGLAERLVADVDKEPGALPLLQYALNLLWERREGRTLSAAVYETTGGLVGALRGKADGLIQSLSEADRRRARRILTGLVGIHEDEGAHTRRRVELATLESADRNEASLVDKVLARLVQERLVVRGQEPGAAATLEIAHEALIRRWDTLRTWVREDRAKLTELAKLKEWVRQWQEDQTLLVGSRLAYASDLVRRYPEDMGDAARQLVRASEARRRRERRLVGLVIVVLASGVLGLAGVSAYAFHQRTRAEEQRARAEEQRARADGLLATAKRIVGELLFDVLPRYADISGTADLQREVYRRLEEIQDTLGHGAEHDAEVARLDLWQQVRRGDLAMSHEDLTRARRRYDEAIAVAETIISERPDDFEAQRGLVRALERLGDLEMEAGDVPAARSALGRSLTLGQALATRHPTDAQAQRDLALVLARSGELEIRAGDLAAARSAMAHALTIRTALAAADPTSAQAQRDLAISFDRLGYVEVQAGALTAARSALGRALALREALALADPTSVQAQRDLSLSLEKAADLELLTGDLAAARAFMDRVLTLREDLAARDPTSARARRDLAVALKTLGDVELKAGDLTGARAAFTRSLQIAEILAVGDPTSAQAQRDVSVALNKLGEVELKAGDLAAARVAFERDLAIAQALAADPSDAQAQRDLSISFETLGAVALEAGDLAAARTAFARSLQIAESLAARDPTNPQARRDLSLVASELGEVERRAGDLSAARAAFARSLQIAETLASADPTDPRAQSDLAAARAAFDQVRGDPGAPP